MLTDCAAHLQRYRNKTTTSLGVLTAQPKKQVEGGFPIVPVYGCRNLGLRAKLGSLKQSRTPPCTEFAKAGANRLSLFSWLRS